MEEAKHAWATLKSVRKLSLLNSNSNNNGNSNKSNSTAIWYDIPAPVIIHCCHEFPDIAKSDNAELIEKRTILAIENEQSTTDIQGNNGLEKYENEETREKRHKNTVELTAVSTVKTDNDGVPKISFSFLHANDNPPRSVLEKSTVMTTVTTTTSTSTIANENGKDESTQDELYDFPRNSYVLDEIESEKVVESEHNCEDEGEIETDGNEIRISQTKFHVESIEVGNVINSPKETCDVSHEEIESSLEKVNNLYVNVRNPNSYDRRKEKKYVRSESDGCDAKFVSISGSYSDPEYSNDTFSNVTRPNGLYPKVLKTSYGLIGWR